MTDLDDTAKHRRDDATASDCAPTGEDVAAFAEVSGALSATDASTEDGCPVDAPIVP